MQSLTADSGTSTTAEAAFERKIALDNCMDIWEGLVPTTGFINKLAYPTPADLAVLLVFQVLAPVGAAIRRAGGYDFDKLPVVVVGYHDKFPKCKALADRTAAAAGVKEYLMSGCSIARLQHLWSGRGSPHTASSPPAP